jgi:FkbM family methyltransferase
MLNWRGLVDVESSEGLKMRLEIEHNLPDKWYFVEGVRSSTDFRKCFDQAIENPAPRLFNFIDIGANSGVISAIAIAKLQQKGIEARLIAVEPQTALMERLAANLSFNKADGAFSIFNCALSDKDGFVNFRIEASDHGKSKISDDPSATLRVPATPLSRIVELEGLTHIDFIKIDVEGHETRIFSEFFSNTPAEIWPAHVFAERTDGGLHDLMVSHGYRMEEIFAADAFFVRER